jgi:hypothetical protein
MTLHWKKVLDTLGILRVSNSTFQTRSTPLKLVQKEKEHYAYHDSVVPLVYKPSL